MNIDLLNKISGLTFYGYHDPSKNMIIVHFFNEEDNKADIIAYLKSDMTWDVREVISEESVLLSDREVVTILHNQISIEPNGSKFDEFVRSSLLKMAKAVHGEEGDLSDIDTVFRILQNNSYDN